MITIGLTKTEAILHWLHQDLGRAVRAHVLLTRYEVDDRTLRRWIGTLVAARFVVVDQGRGANRTIAVYRNERARQRAEAGA